MVDGARNTDLKALGDEQLIAQVVAGCDPAFEELLFRYENPILTFCYTFVRNRETAEDIAQETFLRVYRNAARYQPVAKFTTWIYKIAANLCLNELKKGQLRNCRSLDEPAGRNPDGTRIIEHIADQKHGRPSTEAEKHEVQELIERALAYLPDDQRTTLVMVEYHHMLYEEIAEIEGLTVSGIKMRVKRARESLREALKFLEAENNT